MAIKAKKFQTENDARAYAQYLKNLAPKFSATRYDVVMGPDSKFSIAMIRDERFLGFVK